MLDSFDQSVKGHIDLLAHNCAQAVDTGLYYSFNLFMLVVSFFDGVVDTSEKAMKDVRVMVHLVQNRNIN